MAEIKNAFISSRMNKDLDSRLMPTGEYRNAVNAQISKSEGSDVGTLQNILGNSIASKLGNFGIQNLKSIGYYADQLSNTIYVFLTDHNSDNYNPLANNYIVSYNVLSSTFNTLVTGAFLNFSQTSPIYGVNLLETLLFWTDNRNQPRKINTVSASNNISYYTNEDQISVAKLNPYQCIEFWQESLEAPGYYETTIKDVSSKAYPDGGDCFTVASVTTSSFVAGALSGYINEGASVSTLDELSGVVTILSGISVISYDQVTKTVTLNAAITVASGINIIFNANPYYNHKFFGDPDYLKDKFVRFSYRFTFDDGENSIFAPFTQIAFTPEQDGYFIYQEGLTLDAPLTDDQEDAYRSTEVKFVQNKATEISLRIPLPVNQIDLLNDTKITSIDILYKESDALAVQVIETIKVAQIAQQSIQEGYYIYKYNSQKPYKTLPSSEIIRVYDKIPVKAFSQEIISNRVVYGNYQDKHTPPVALNYNVAITEKSIFDVDFNYTSRIEYPSHTVKSNRSYQVGVILADKFGRQSTTLLSSNTTPITVGLQTYSGSTVYLPYAGTDMIADTWPGSSIKLLFNDPIPVDRSGFYPGVYNGDSNSEDYNPLGWYSYKIVVKQLEQEYYNVYLPGVMAAYPDDPTKELGKTSHVVLINDNINKIPRDLTEVGPTQRQFRSSVKLYGRVENTTNTVNKNTQFYPSTVASIATSIADNNELFNGEGLPPGTGAGNYTPSVEFYNIDSNPLICRISTKSKLGVVDVPNQSDIINLAILETYPVSSLLEIFWESTSSGLISDLNSAILEESGGAVILSEWNQNDFTEDIELSENVLNSPVWLKDAFGVNIPLGQIESFDMTSVFNTESTPQNVSDYFEWIETAPGSENYNIQVTQLFIDNIWYFWNNNSGHRSFIFTLTAVVNGSAIIFTRNAYLKNIVPSLTGCPVTIIRPSISDTNIGDPLSGINGCSNVLNQNEDLTYQITSQKITGTTTDVTHFGIESEPIGNFYEGQLTNITGPTIPALSYDISILLYDGGGVNSGISCDFVVDFGFIPDWVKQYNYHYPEPPGPGDTFNFIVINATSSPYGGYYSYNGTWDDLTGGGTIDSINIPTSPYTCGGNWLFSIYLDYVDQANQGIINDSINCWSPGGQYAPSITINTIDATNYTFTVV